MSTAKFLIVFAILFIYFSVFEDQFDGISPVLTVITILATVVSIFTIIHVIIDLPFGATDHTGRSIGGFSFGVVQTIGVDMHFAVWNIMLATGILYSIRVIRNPRTYLSARLQYVRPVFGIFFVFMMSAAYINQSRAFWLSLFAVGVIYSTHNITSRSLHRNTTIMFISLVILSPLLYFFVTHAIKLIINVNPIAIENRVDQYRLALELMIKHPLGIGFGGYSSISNVTVHNLWLYLGVSLGPLIGVAWTLPFVSICRRSIWGLQSDSKQVTDMNLIRLSIIVIIAIQAAFHLAMFDLVGVLLGIGIIDPSDSVSEST
jgi:hypothetical protein